MGRIAILRSGVWRLRGEIAALTGLQPVRRTPLGPGGADAVAGWGHKPTALAARRLAARSRMPYFGFEDGPLRSVRPGPGEKPLSLVMDRGGIYYDAGSDSDLFRLLADPDGLPPDLLSRAASAAGMLRRLRLSKYNAGPDRSEAELGLSPKRGRRVLVLDQVHDDASIAGALADGDSFAAMLDAALGDDAAAEVVVKLHPDVLSGRRAGYFSGLRQDERLRLVAAQTNPWSLIDIADAVYTVSSGLGFEAVLAGREVVTFGSPFYSGWGFTDDRRLRVSRPRFAPPLEIFAAYYLRYTHYFDAYTRRETDFETAAEQLAWLRDRFLEETARPVLYRMPRWKRETVDRMLDGPAGSPLHVRDAAEAVAKAKAAGGPLVAWSSRDTRRLQEMCRNEGVPFTQVEDGFIRSAGLGASFVQPSSLVFDARGIFYDSTRPSDLELMLEGGEFPLDLLLRAARLRERLVVARTSKYNVGTRQAGERFNSAGRPIVLVPGQVEDDASIRRGSPVIARNLDLLRAARARNPEDFLVYKPHPDVEAGLRSGKVPEKEAAGFADCIVTQASIIDLIEAADAVETMTSLAGFEALLRGKRVTTHGQPFYAGWGLTEDLAPVARRTRRRSLDELVAAALILYPRYLDPETRLRCTPELLVDRLAAATARPPARAESLLRLARVSAGRALHVGRAAIALASGRAGSDP